MFLFDHGMSKEYCNQFHLFSLIRVENLRQLEKHKLENNDFTWHWSKTRVKKWKKMTM